MSSKFRRRAAMTNIQIVDTPGIAVGDTPIRTNIKTRDRVRFDTTLISPLEVMTSAQLSVSAIAINNYAILDGVMATIPTAPIVRGKPRTALTVPVLSNPTSWDGVLYEDPITAAPRWYLPRYRIATQTVGGAPRYRVKLAETNGQWRLEITLEAFAAPEINIGQGDIQPLQHTLTARLHWDMLGVNGAVRELPFTERLDNSDGTVTVALQVATLQERDELYTVLTKPDAHTTLIIGRSVTVALPVTAIVVPENTGIVPDFTRGLGAEMAISSATLRSQDLRARFNPSLGIRFDPNIEIIETPPIIWLPPVITDEVIPILTPPDIEITGVEPFDSNGTPYARYKIRVKNWDAYTEDLFAASPDLPPCGNNTNAARTWVDIFDSNQQRLYGFCALGKPADLQELWVAAPISAVPTGIYIQLVDRRANLSARSNVVVPPAVVLYEETSRVVEQTAPLFFNPELHGYIFEGFSRPTGTQQGLVRYQVFHKGRPFAYYQDSVRPHLFYYLPDTFKLMRGLQAPHTPALGVELLTSGAGDQYRLTYAALPHYDWDRLESAEPSLQTHIPNGHPTALAMEPFQTSQAAFVPFNPTLYAAGLPTLVNLQVVQAIVTLSLDDFTTVWDGLNGLTPLTLDGKVRVDVQGFPAEEVPLQLRLEDTVGEVLTVQFGPDEANDGYLVQLINHTESPLKLNTVSPFLQSASLGLADLRPATWQQFQQLEDPLPPNAEVRALLISRDSLSLADFLPFVDTDEVRSIPNTDAIFDAILSNSVRAYQRPVTVKVANGIFAHSSGAIAAIEVSFVNGGSVTLTPSDPPVAIVTQTANVRYPLKDALLRKPISDWYQYRVVVAWMDGRVSPPSVPQTGDTESFFLNVPQLA